jgi:hypothetical protein
MTGPDLSDDAWLAGVDGEPRDNILNPVQLDDSAAEFPPEPPALPETLPDTPVAAQTPPRSNKAVAAGFGAVVAALTVGLSVALLVMRSGPATAPLPAESPTHISVAAAVNTDSSAGPTAPGQDVPIPYTASASCPPGSTAAQSMSGADPTQAFVCVRNHLDGQVITLDMGRSVVVTAISLSPGWVGKDGSGQDQWTQHRVVSRVQYVFNDTATTVVTQDTGNIHGEAVVPVPHGVLASKIVLIVLQTSRAPTEPTSTSTETPPGVPLLDDVLGAPPTLKPSTTTGAQPQPDDAVDNTFAISSLKILGHLPQ